MAKSKKNKSKAKLNLTVRDEQRNTMQEKTARSAVAHAGIGISPARRGLTKGGYQYALAGKSMPQYTKPPVPRLFGTGTSIVS